LAKEKDGGLISDVWLGCEKGEVATAVFSASLVAGTLKPPNPNGLTGSVLTLAGGPEAEVSDEDEGMEPRRPCSEL
jgi:hypothetical protein